MVVRSALVLISGVTSQLPPGDLVPGQDTTAQASGNAALVVAENALASGNLGISDAATALASGNAALVDSATALSSGNAALVVGIDALASGNAALIDSSTALASGNAALLDSATALASGNAALVDSATALASGNAALVDSATALASGNAALTDLGGKYDKTGGPISGPVTVQSQSVGTPGFVISSGVCILNFGAQNNFEVTLTDNSTLASPVSASGGQSGAIVIRQDSTGSRLLTYSGGWRFVSDTAPTLTTTASGVDLLAYYVVNPSRINVVSTLNYGSGTVA
jgi:hypothetical protein